MRQKRVAGTSGGEKTIRDIRWHRANFSFWLQADLQPPEIGFRFTPRKPTFSWPSLTSGCDPGCVKTSTALFLLPMIPVCFGGGVS